jgi:hypothetical protein
MQTFLRSSHSSSQILCTAGLPGKQRGHCVVSVVGPVQTVHAPDDGRCGNGPRCDSASPSCCCFCLSSSCCKVSSQSCACCWPVAGHPFDISCNTCPVALQPRDGVKESAIGCGGQQLRQDSHLEERGPGSPGWAAMVTEQFHTRMQSSIHTKHGVNVLHATCRRHVP